METTEQTQTPFTGIKLFSGFEDTKALLSDDSKPSHSIWIIRNYGIFEFNTVHNSLKQINFENWSGTKCACYGDGYIYTIGASGKLYKTPVSGATKAKLLADDDWTNARHLVYKDKALYLWTDNAYRVDPDSGSYSAILKGDWSASKSITSIGGTWYSGEGKLCAIDSESSKWRILNAECWKNTHFLVSHGKKLYAACANLYDIDIESGEYQKLSIDFSNDVITSDENKNLDFAGNDLLGFVIHGKYFYGIWNSGNLWRMRLD